MIKFFRNIRQNAIKDNKISNYLKYAIGEIVLVVIGILIALQINSWNQSRINRLTETKYLKSIKKELILNNNLNQLMITDRFTKKLEGLKLAKKYSENEIMVIDTLEFLNNVSYGGVFSGGFYFGNRSSYDELISTGNLRLIRKDTIRNAIADYYAYINTASQRAEVHGSRFSSYTSELRPFNSKNPTYISEYDQVEMMESLKTEKFRKLVDLELSYAYKIRDYIETVKSRGNQTIRLINLELNDKLGRYPEHINIMNKK
jgi:hypothetical protein